MAKTIRSVEEAAEDLIQKAEQKRAAYLREHGWQYTSSTPACYWMWCKVWQGKQWTYFKANDAMRAESWMQEMGDDTEGALQGSGHAPATDGGKGPEHG